MRVVLPIGISRQSRQVLYHEVVKLQDRLRVLFVCTANQQRSPTAEALYRDDPRFEVASAGTSEYANRPVSTGLLKWADLVVAMENHHRRLIIQRFPAEARSVRFIVLGIPDVFQYMDRALQKEIRERFEAAM